MPTTRKSSGGRSSAGGGKQATLSFNHRVTKSVPKVAKDAALSSAQAATPAKPSPLSKLVKAEDEVEQPAEKGEEEEEEEEEDAQEEREAAQEKSESDVRAEKITDAQVKKYWKGLEEQRMAKRVHQGDLTVGEKVLRYFDVSSQYGPCVGIPRLRRWKRAENLGLNPPIEVLAVLLKEEPKGNKDTERAHIDEILNPSAVGAA